MYSLFEVKGGNILSIGTLLIYFGILLILPMIAQSKVKSTYKKYSEITTSSKKSGAEVAREILNDNGLYDVSIEEVQGTLTDHYDPRSKVVRLSTEDRKSVV